MWCLAIRDTGDRPCDARRISMFAICSRGSVGFEGQYASCIFLRQGEE